MAATLTVLYAAPDDPAAFDEHYRTVHMPIVARWPGVESAELTRIETTLGVNDYHLMASIRFADRAALDAALASPAGRESGEDFRRIAPRGSFMLIGTTE